MHFSWIDHGSNQSCPDVVLNDFRKRIERQMWQTDGLMLFNTIVMGVVVFVSVFAPRYRRHPIIGFIFQGANTLFLPIVSVVVSTARTDRMSSLYYEIMDEWITAIGEASLHNILVSAWTGLVVYVGIGTSIIVAGDSREGRNIEPSKELLFKAIWVAYIMQQTLWRPAYWIIDFSGPFSGIELNLGTVRTIFGILIACTLCKIFHKCQVFYVAQGSFIFGRNPRLIVSYMDQLDGSQDTKQVEGHVMPPPPLIVMEGGAITLEKQPHGYSYKYGTEHQRSDCKISLMKYVHCTFSKERSGHKMIKTNKGSELVTLDRVWGLDDTYLSTPQAKDMCFSFALMKLLRCRFAKYTVSEAGFTKARKFFWHTYLLQGADYSRLFRVIADELSFFHDYYYSFVSIPFFRRQFLLTRVLILVLSTGLCLYTFVSMSQKLGNSGGAVQMKYLVTCSRKRDGGKSIVYFGYLYFDVVPVYFVLAAVLISEIRETVSYLCSNFTKVVLICNYVSNRRCRKFVAFVFKYLRCDWLLNNWEDKMSQCKLLVFHPREVSILWRRLFRLPNQKKIKVPSEVKEAIFKALKGLASDKHIRLPRSPISNSVDARSACGGKGAADTILAWHIATSIFEVRQPQPSGNLLGCKTAAVRLSQYCAYLVGYRSELLPDNVEWCKTLHQAVTKEAARVLSGHAAKPTPEEEFQQLVRLLAPEEDEPSADSNHGPSADSNLEVLKHGARLAEKLVRSRKGWEELAQFWSEMILYIAPSENLDGHAEAISRGGELVTLLWALLAHAGIVDRLDDVLA